MAESKAQAQRAGAGIGEIAPGAPERAVAPSAAMARRLVWVFAFACGLVVANLYYSQPLLDEIAREFGVGSGTAGLLVTLTQLGYAAGLLLIVPLGDRLDRRRLIFTVLSGTIVALLAAMVAPSIALLAVAGVVIGLTSVVAQVLVPFAATLAGDAERGRVVGQVMSGLLLGILLARVVAGILGQLVVWRAVYGIAALLMVGLLALLWRELPTVPVAPGAGSGSYAQLLRSVGVLIREEPLLRRRMAYGALIFAAFSVLWTSLSFLLARPPFGYGEALIGVFGLLGAAGALCASFAGRLADRGLTRPATGGFLLTMLVSFGLLALGKGQLIPLIIGILLLDLGAQGVQVSNQSVIYRLRPEARSRLNTAYMTSYFAGGAIGSATSAVAFARGGWAAVCLIGAVYIGLALLLWLTERGPWRMANDE
ncbi:MAG TPA: MFS transporter [Thermomicrobiales bacterium]|jgi:predicted MFS family arabinose efflux permease